jgi:hypothetical protein
MLVLSSMQPDTARRTTAAAFIRQWLRLQHETAKEKGPLEATSSSPTGSFVFFVRSWHFQADLL